MKGKYRQSNYTSVNIDLIKESHPFIHILKEPSPFVTEPGRVNWFGGGKRTDPRHSPTLQIEPLFSFGLQLRGGLAVEIDRRL